MQKSSFLCAFFVFFSLLITSCSKEDDSGLGKDPANKAILSFGTLLNDLSGKQGESKQSIDEMPACSEDIPAFVELVLYRDGNPVVGTLGNAARITVNQNPFDNDNDGVEEYFTEAASALELEPGVYSLEYFTVLNASEEMIWLSPRRGEDEGRLWNFVETSLPFDIALGAGVKKYVEVEVLCFDDRNLNDYGYLFFDLESNQALEYCLFANYCTPEGIEYPAKFSVDVWLGDDDTGTVLYTDLQNKLSIDDAVARAEPLCIVLPNLSSYNDDEPYLYYEMTLLDWEEGYGEVEPAVIEGRLSRNDIAALFDGDSNIDFEHLRFGCGEGSTDDPEGGCPADNDCDGVPNEDDLCPGKDDKEDADEDGLPDDCDECPDAPMDKDEDGDCIRDDEDPCPDNPDTSCEESIEDVITKCETVYMYGDHTLIEDGDGVTIPGPKWGWAEFINEGDGDYSYSLFADRADNDLEIGQVHLQVEGGKIELEIELFEGNSLKEAQIYLSGKKPRKNGNGHFHYRGSSLSYDLEIKDNKDNKGFWIMIRADVCPNRG